MLVTRPWRIDNGSSNLNRYFGMKQMFETAIIPEIPLKLEFRAYKYFSIEYGNTKHS